MYGSLTLRLQKLGEIRSPIFVSPSVDHNNNVDADEYQTDKNNEQSTYSYQPQTVFSEVIRGD